MVPLALLGLALYVVVYPCLVFYVLLVVVRRDPSSKLTIRYFGYLYERFRPRYYYYDLLLLLPLPPTTTCCYYHPLPTTTRTADYDCHNHY